MSNEDIIHELKKISKLLTFAYSDKIIRELEKMASTEKRKMMWVLIDGTKDPEEISKRVGLSARSVYDFQNILEAAGLANNPWGKPASKIFDYVPPEWIELLPPEKVEGDEVNNE
jgi:hypothetical protein